MTEINLQQVCIAGIDLDGRGYLKGWKVCRGGRFVTSTLFGQPVIPTLLGQAEASVRLGQKSWRATLGHQQRWTSKCSMCRARWKGLFKRLGSEVIH